MEGRLIPDTWAGKWQTEDLSGLECYQRNHDGLHMCVQSLPSTVPKKNMLIQGLFVQDLLPKAIKEQWWLAGCSTEDERLLFLVIYLIMFGHSLMGTNKICFPLVVVQLFPGFVVQSRHHLSAPASFSYSSWYLSVTSEITDSLWLCFSHRLPINVCGGSVWHQTVVLR